jgi:hypothetical protein
LASVIDTYDGLIQNNNITITKATDPTTQPTVTIKSTLNFALFLLIFKLKLNNKKLNDQTQIVFKYCIEI